MQRTGGLTKAVSGLATVDTLCSLLQRKSLLPGMTTAASASALAADPDDDELVEESEELEGVDV